MSATTILSPGAVISYSGTSANVAIPTAANGSAPKYVRLVSTTPCYVRVGIGGALAAVAGDMMIQPADSMIVRAHGCDRIAAIQVGAAGVLQISPIEDM